VGSDVLVCGGADETNTTIDSCDLIDGSTYMIKSTQHMATARRGHLALQLETGPVVILGGFGSDGKPLSAVGIYTPYGPGLPHITVYVERLRARVVGQPLEKIRLASPFLLRSVEPPLSETFGKKVVSISRIGKRIVFDLESDLHVVLHLMVAGRLKW